MHTKLWSQNLQERDHLEDTHSTNVKNKRVGMCQLDASGSMEGLCKQPLGSPKHV